MSSLLPDIRIRQPSAFELVLIVLGCTVWYLTWTFVVKPFTSPLKSLVGPEGGRGAQGHALEIMDYQSDSINNWMKKYGSTFLVRGPFGVHHRLFTVDPRALAHVLGNTNVYTKSDMLREVVRKWMKEGLITAEGHRHKLQRKITQRLFSKAGMRRMESVVRDKANQLRDIYLELCSNPQTTAPFASKPTSTDTLTSTREIDVYASACRCTFDIIGTIAIEHEFDVVGQPEAQGGIMYENYEKMQGLPTSGVGRILLGMMCPWTEKIWPSEDTRRTRKAMDPLEDLSKKMMVERRRQIQEGKRDLAHERDLLTLMLRANLVQNIGEDEKLRDDEITGQLATFMFAGSDTTAGTIAFGLHQLALNPSVQTRLRNEILTYGDSLSYDQLDDLVYLDAVTKEILRFCPSLPGTIRQAQKNDVIPLSKPVHQTTGETVSEIKIRKGQLVHIPIEHLNLSPEIWGPTSDQFNPDRFLPTTTTTATVDIPHGQGVGVWPNILTFLDGPRRCVGYKLALMEIKIMLFTLLREFQFDVLPGVTIQRWNMLTSRPFVAGSLRSKGWTLPLLIRPYHGDTNLNEKSS